MPRVPINDTFPTLFPEVKDKFDEHDDALDTLEAAVLALQEAGSNSGLPSQVVAPLAGAAASIGFSGLDGDTDGGYRFHARILNPSGGSVTYQVIINGATTGLSYDRNVGGGAHLGDGAAGSDFMVETLGGGTVEVTIDIFAKSGLDRMMQVHASISGTASSTFDQLATLHWNDAATNITSLGISVSGGASNVGIGSSASIWVVPFGQT